MDRLARLLATGFYTGASPIAPGTAGSLLALAILWGVDTRFPLARHAAGLALATVFFFAVGVWAASRVEAQEIRRGGRKDPSIITVDEMVGMGVSVLGWPASAARPWLFAAFLLFRVFDVVKPFPTARLQNLRGGWGILADDVVAGIYANACVRILIGVFN
jgi:phosphatidylglycerophosphatase A